MVTTFILQIGWLQFISLLYLIQLWHSDFRSQNKNNNRLIVFLKYMQHEVAYDKHIYAPITVNGIRYNTNIDVGRTT